MLSFKKKSFKVVFECWVKKNVVVCLRRAWFVRKKKIMDSDIVANHVCVVEACFACPCFRLLGVAWHAPVLDDTVVEIID